MDKFIEQLKTLLSGNKTYVCVVLSAIVSYAFYKKWIDEPLYTLLLTITGGGAIAGLKAGQARNASAIAENTEITKTCLSTDKK